MSEEEREQLITAIYLRTNYALSYLESLSDEDLREHYERQMNNE